ncbi:NCT transcriptional regulatory complex subunit A [Fulvia fulva]|uniref:NCT transcriptional regulatory complex subunit A n=1 Tax=Passalora fulva TaxID=5499 RepID=A0A9Q8LJ11_PASFU|nr:NCT transcriptional regulatory complex subunit A [Fulvia fulva]KAK4623741.1 NCT transcriptional regulatory complex subunit A [Fulvia fulva]KAK4625579.1 NCT transcriptional regulatory complex subunit A [Fulvia fulva]UJO18280.1 NCT transcriptional regulatory complex subunit A [Fulvia fulva]WPV14627.1 NCT transcriptional regulatory complex subunit A [Fulvia fulva]WPV30159.1 NCT transcriptional regulatory complex subunit A [Fulvia fulva]
MDYRPESPDLSNLTGARPVSPDLSGINTSQSQPLGEFNQQAQHFPTAFGAGHRISSASTYQPQPTSVPHYSPYDRQYQPYQQYSPPTGMPPRQFKAEDEDEYMPDANDSSKRPRRLKQEHTIGTNGAPPIDAAPFPIKAEAGDATLGCTINTTFPVARIKRIMQADEDIGKVAQVTPTVVSRALELFMIKLISQSAVQARGLVGAGGTSGKGPKRILAQHMKAAVNADDVLDFLGEIVNKIPDAPVKAAKKETGSESEEAKPKRRSKKRKDSGDDV